MAEMLSQEQATGQTSAVTTDTSGADYSAVSMLAPLDGVFIKQPIRGKEMMMEMFCGCEMSNFYTCQYVNPETNSVTPLFDLREESNCCLRQCCGAQRPLELKAVSPGDENEETVPLFLIDKPYRAGCCCCPSTSCCGRNYMDIWVGNTTIGSVREKCMCNCRVAYGIHDTNGELLYSIERCACYCECMQVGFEILDANGEETGKKISKLYDGLMKEMFTTNDNFLVEFPSKDSSMQVKLLIVCAAMMIEFRHFEQKKEQGGGDVDM